MARFSAGAKGFKSDVEKASVEVVAGIGFEPMTFRL
jgi:hypothetical protein